MTFRAKSGGRPRILDLSRTVARGAGRIPTGIDRAELAYLQEMLNADDPVFGLIRTRLGYLLLDRSGLSGLAAAVRDPSRTGELDGLSRFTRRSNPARGQMETHARKLAIGRSTPVKLGALLERHLPVDIEHLNVGHSNLTTRVFRALSRVSGSTSTVLLHDLLPLSHPQYCRPESTRRAKRMVEVVSRHAGQVVHTTSATRASTEAYLKTAGRCPPGITAPLGIREPRSLGWPGQSLRDPYFIAIGTLEPRKNLGFLLDLWEALAKAPETGSPTLVIAGVRGWEDAAFFDRLNGHAGPGNSIRWIEAADDEQVDAFLSGARALLFPSHAEGLGLPPLEAASAGVPVLCQDLPPLRELLGEYPDYFGCDDLAGWIEKIKGLLAGQTPQRLTAPDSLPTWRQHFAMVMDGEKSVETGDRSDKGSALCV